MAQQQYRPPVGSVVLDPDDLSDEPVTVSADDLSDGPQPSGPTKTHRVTRGMFGDFGDMALNLLQGIKETVLPTDRLSDVVEGPMQVARDPKLAVELLWEAISGAMRDQAGKTAESAGRVLSEPTMAGKAMAASETLGHGLATVLPIVGPAAANTGETIASGETARGIGQGMGLLAPFAPRGPKGSGVQIVRGAGRTANPTEAAAVAFGESRGVPIDAATATGSQLLRNTQKRVSAQVGGAGVAERVQGAQAEALSRVGGETAKKVYPSPVSPVAAGENVTKALGDLRARHSAEADAAYGRLRAMEAKATPENVPVKQQGAVGGKPVTVTTNQPMKLAVDVRPAKAAMKATYNQLKREASLVPLQGDKARALVALDRLMQGPDFAPLSIADAARGELLALGRTKDGALLSAGKGVVAQTAKQLDMQIMAAARQAGPDAVKALQDGRKATVEKYRTNLVGEKVAGRDMAREPRDVFDALTAGRDGSVARLRQVAKQTPDEIPKIARAWLEERLDKARANGKFEHTDRLLADWQKLGDETKRLLFGERVGDLDNFFLLAKKINENVNPSGTAQVLSANLANPKHWLGALPNWALAKLLYEPGGVTRVINGVRMPLPRNRPRTMQTAAGASAQRPRPTAPQMAEDKKKRDQEQAIR